MKDKFPSGPESYRVGRKSIVTRGTCAPSGEFPFYSFPIGTNAQVGTRVPNYRQKILLGQEAGSNYSCDLYFVNKVKLSEFRYGNSNYGCNDKQGIHEEWCRASSMQGTNFLKQYSDSALDNIAISKIRNFANKADAHANVIVPLVELRDLHATVKGVSQATSVMLTTMLDLTKAIKHPKELVKYASDAWLTYSFGVKPMLSDASQIAQSIAATGQLPLRSNVSAKSTKTWHGTSIDTARSIGWISNASYKRRHVMELTYRYTYGLSSLRKSANNYTAISDLNNHLGLRVESFIPAIWELIPYSWLIDYFVNIGDCLEDRFTASPSVRYGCKSVLYRETVTSEAQNVLAPPAPPGYQDLSNPGGYELEHVHYVRTVSSSLPVRSFGFNTFSTIGSYAPNKLLNLISILGKSNKISALRL